MFVFFNGKIEFGWRVALHQKGVVGRSFQPHVPVKGRTGRCVHVKKNQNTKDPKDLGSANLIRTPRPFRLKDERDAPMSRQLTVET